MNEKRLGYPRSIARKVLHNYFEAYPPMSAPIPVEEIAKFNGFEVYRLDTMSKSQRGIKLEGLDGGRKLIGVNSEYHIHNQRFSIGHELGHHFLGHPSEDDCDLEEMETFNKEADEFSAELLMPLELLKGLISKLKDPSAIAKAFLVSEEAFWWKVKAQNLLSLF